MRDEDAGSSSIHREEMTKATRLPRELEREKGQGYVLICSVSVHQPLLGEDGAISVNRVNLDVVMVLLPKERFRVPLCCDPVWQRLLGLPSCPLLYFLSI